MKQTILVGVSGGIAAFKTLELVRSLKARGTHVTVIMTASAAKMIPPGEFAKVSGNPVYTDLFGGSVNYQKILEKRKVEHIELANNSSLFVIVPATANVIAKLAHGIADDYLTTTALAATCPIVLCPSMNVFMWRHPTTQKNIQTLKDIGVAIFGPDSGMLACGYEGEGRLMDVYKIADELMRLLKKTNSLKRKRVIVTAGATREPIDGIRFITNKSTGKMGIAIAEACFLSGASVTLLRSTTAVSPRYKLHEHTFETADELEVLLNSEIKTADICFHAAAVSDFSVKNKRRGKISSGQPLPLELTPRSKILDTIKRHNPGVFLVAFKAEWGLRGEKLAAAATSRLRQAKADLIVANDVSGSDRGFAADSNEVVIIDPKRKNKTLPLASKTIIATQIVEEVEKRFR